MSNQTRLPGKARPPETGNPDFHKLAAEYSAKFDGVSMLVMVDGRIIFEDYPNGGSRQRINRSRGR